MILILDKKNEKPLYIQVRDQLSDLISKQILEPGTKLPATRKLARQLGVNRNTVLAAYTDLEVEGKISTQIGNGTFVNEVEERKASRDDENPPDSDIFSNRFVTRMNSGSRSQYSIYQEYFRQDPDVISFAFPSSIDKDFPFAELQKCAYSSIQQFGKHIFDLSQPSGFLQLRHFLPGRLLSKGIRISEENLVIVNGQQDGLDLITRILTCPGETIITDQITSPEALEIFAHHGLNIVGILHDEEGMRIDRLEESVKRETPKFIYSIPNYYLPVNMSVERKKSLLDLAGRFKIPIIENDIMSDIHFGQEERSSLKSMDNEGIVTYLSGFSNLLMGKVQIGWIAAPVQVVEGMIEEKNAHGPYNNNLIQAIMCEFVQRGFYDKLLKKSVRICKKHRDLTEELLQQYLPQEISFRRVQGGDSVWIDLPGNLSGAAIAGEALKQKVAVIPKSVFSTSSHADDGVRLCFASPPISKIETGVRILSQVIMDAMDD